MSRRRSRSGFGFGTKFQSSLSQLFSSYYSLPTFPHPSPRQTDEQTDKHKQTDEKKSINRLSALGSTLYSPLFTLLSQENEYTGLICVGMAQSHILKFANQLPCTRMSADNKDSSERYVLSLYIAGMTPKSTRVIEKLKEACEKNLKGHYKLEIVDITKNPELAQKENIVASPTLVKRLPLPVRNLIGDMTDKDRLYFGLELLPEKRIP